MHCEKTQLTKIGWSREPARRYIQLQAESAFELKEVVLLMCPPGLGSYFESLLHKRFASKRAFQEWFKLDDEDIKFFLPRTVLAATLEHAHGFEPDDPGTLELLAMPEEEMAEWAIKFKERLPYMQSDHFV